ncbi:DUF2089 family protein [Pediococcus argentinicus]|uniref:DUF2089 domain-containing protein n=1 Tax=Pediococcus argentinicus TaxID=480391 RepID=A0A0R2NMP2_9LACO|nr:DUF2089 family protein [Pediococcus argentinicus]KRO25947.1 hypothetical protein IV88_GL001215 [Pediococcus argentinicus]NKZ21802.1 DUF2089 domain-containing protein [Pediococcus argentinicus]GEP18938.1 hypothetical protein LSA03_03220 [Pediococcus argentinicus]
MDNWYQEIPEEDMNFIKKFILASGSLKQVAKDYSVSYPTVRLRLDEVIKKIGLIEKKYEDPFIVNVMRMVTSEEITYAAAKQIISLYEKEKNNE